MAGHGPHQGHEQHRDPGVEHLPGPGVQGPEQTHSSPDLGRQIFLQVTGSWSFLQLAGHPPPYNLRMMMLELVSRTARSFPEPSKDDETTDSSF